jgi:hypothetical protein
MASCKLYITHFKNLFPQKHVFNKYSEEFLLKSEMPIAIRNYMGSKRRFKWLSHEKDQESVFKKLHTKQELNI